ncbi:MAG: EamA family transporter, partial [Chloroflexota bacterium]
MKSDALPQNKPVDLPAFNKWGVFAATVTIVLWASAFAGIRVGLESYSPYSLALLRYLVASVVLAIYTVAIRAPLPDWRDLPFLTLMGFLGFSVYNVALNAGEDPVNGVSAGVASFIIASAPVYIALLSYLFLNERLTAWGWVGIVVSFIGVTLVSFATDEGFRVNGRALLILVAAMAQALYTTYQRPYLRKYGALRFTTYAIWTGTALMLVYLPGLVQDFNGATAEATWAIVYMGVFPGAIGYVCWSYVLSKLSPSVAGSFLYLIPAVAVLIAWLWLGEVPGLLAIVGGVVIVAGVVIVNRLGRVAT